MSVETDRMEEHSSPELDEIPKGSKHCVNCGGEIQESLLRLGSTTCIDHRPMGNVILPGAGQTNRPAPQIDA